jgi:hypothetical protein
LATWPLTQARSFFRCRRPRHIPASHRVLDHTEHTPATSNSQMIQVRVPAKPYLSPVDN